jgi:phasin
LHNQFSAKRFFPDCWPIRSEFQNAQIGALAIAQQYLAHHIQDFPKPAELSGFALGNSVSWPKTQRVTLPKRRPPTPKTHWNKSKKAAEETTKIMEQSYVTASKGAVDFNLQLTDIAQANMNAACDFARHLSSAKSPSELFELSAAHARKQFETLTEQTRHFTSLAQKVTTEVVQPLQTAVGKTFDQPVKRSD